ncbi:MAG: BrnT family toxin [Verrucomicrobia bacterium]|nr:BrnT family toxin [Verrucomicrobiota bacterium]
MTVGLSHRQRMVIVVHCDRGENIRIISARRATPAERRHYEND